MTTAVLYCEIGRLLGGGQYKTTSRIDAQNLVILYLNSLIPRVLFRQQQDIWYCCHAADANINIDLKICTGD